MKIFVLCISFFLSCIVMAYSATDSTQQSGIDTKKPKNYIGTSFSTISGIGISYHRLIGSGNLLGIKLTFFYNPDKYSGGMLKTNLGGELQLSLFNIRYYRLFALLGGSIRDNVLYSGPTKHFGPGIGNEFLLFNRIALNVDAGMSFISRHRYIDNKGNTEEYFSTFPGIGLGLSYAF